MAREPDGSKDGERTHAARDVRQGEIILRRPWQRAVFIAGLIGLALLAIFGGLWAAG